jgi:hypothetical protein
VASDNRTLVQIPLAGGINQKAENEWLDPTQNQGSISNGQFTKDGAISKRQGMKFLNTFHNVSSSTTSKFVSWSKQAFASTVSYTNGEAFFNCWNITQQAPGLSVPVPPPRTIRRGLSNVPTFQAAVTSTNVTSVTPVVVDCPDISVRLIFTVFNAGTYVSQIDLITGNTLGAAFTLVYGAAAAVITGFELQPSAGSEVIVLLQIAGTSTSLVGLTITGIGTSNIVSTVNYGPFNAQCADICPFVGDPNNGFIVFYQTTAGGWKWEYHLSTWTLSSTGVLETTNASVGSECCVCATYTSPGGVGFLYNYYNGTSLIFTRFADLNASLAVVDAPSTIATFTSSNTRPNLAGMAYYQGTFFSNIWQLQQTAAGTAGVLCPQWLPLTIVSGSPPSLGANPGMTSFLGMWPVGRPFFIPGQPSSLYQPVVLQLKTISPGTPLGSQNTYGVAQSGQCTLYLLNLTRGTIVSTSAPRQVDPTFSWQAQQFFTGSLPQSCYTGNRFSQVINTLGQDVPGLGYVSSPSWTVDWFFDQSSQSLLYQSNEVAGDMHLQASVPMVSDGNTMVEDGFFYYPEFANATIPGSGPTWTNAPGTYNYFVVYTYIDGTGQLARSSPVGTVTSVSPTTGGFAPAVNFPPMNTTYRNAVTAEIYRNIMVGGVQSGTFYLVTTLSAQYSSTGSGTYPVNSITVTNGGYAYTGGTPTVTITPVDGHGSGATATATIGGGGASSVTILNQGSNYTSNFAFNFTGGTGSGATGYATVGTVPGQTYVAVLNVQITNPGTGYATAFNTTLVGGGGNTCVVTVGVTASVVSAVTVTNAGSGYDLPPTVTFSYGPATATASLVNAASTANNLQFIDAVPDATIQQSSVLYTTGGVLDAVNPPSASCQCIHWNRKWIVDETLATIWFTQPFSLGEVPYFNEALQIYYPDGGDITAIAGMDDKLVIFKLNSISVVYGQGPADNGQGSDLTLPQPIATDSGAVDWRSVVLTPAGLMFQSKTGIYLLDRGLNVTWIGKAVVDSLAYYPTILSATLVPTATQVRFVCQNPNTNQCIVLVYDYLNTAWTTFNYQVQPSNITSSSYVNTTFDNAQGELVPGGVFVTMTADGSMWRELNPLEGRYGSLAPYEDQDTSSNNYFVPTSVTSAWIKTQGIQGFQRASRVQLYAPISDPANLTLSVAVNYNPAIVQSNTWTASKLAKLPLTQVEMYLAGAYNLQMAYQVTMSDSGAAGTQTGQGAAFVSCAMELQQVNPRYPMIPAAGRA